MFKLRKAPKRELYWVVNKETGKKYSKDPLPHKRAQQQMKALYAAESRGELDGAGWVGDAFGYLKSGVSAVKQRVSDVMKGKRQDYPPKVRAYLAANGDRPIGGLTIRRDPIRSMLHSVINVLTLGKWAEARKKYAYDKVFHLGLEVKLDAGPTTTVEKNQVINVGPAGPPNQDTETMVIGDPGSLTLRQMLDNTQKLMGDRYFNYSAFENNCQDFIIAILRANNLWTPARDAFIKQPVDELAKELPSYTGRIANVATDLAAVADVAIHGRGRRREAATFLKSLRGGQMTTAERDALRQRIRAAREIDLASKGRVRCPADKVYDPEKEYSYGDNVCVERPDGTVTYTEIQDPNDPKENCLVGHPSGPKRSFGVMKRSECMRINEEGLKKWQESRSGTDKFFDVLLKGLTTVADVGTDLVKDIPGIGKIAANVYQQFAPPGSAYYQPDKATGQKIEDTVRGIVGMGKTDTIVMTKKQFVKEHQNLIRLLRKYQKADLLKEAADQEAELKKYTGGSNEEAFLQEARRKAKAAGLNWQSLQLSDKSGKKLIWTNKNSTLTNNRIAPD